MGNEKLTPLYNVQTKLTLITTPFHLHQNPIKQLSLKINQIVSYKLVEHSLKFKHSIITLKTFKLNVTPLNYLNALIKLLKWKSNGPDLSLYKVMNILKRQIKKVFKVKSKTLKNKRN